MSAIFHVQNIIVFAAVCQSDMTDLLFPISSTFLCIAIIFNMGRDMAEFSPSQLELCMLYGSSWMWRRG